MKRQPSKSDASALDQMHYIKRTLLDDEKIVYAVRPHWIIFANPCIYFIVALLLWAGGGTLLSLDNIYILSLSATSWLALILVAMGLIYLLSAYVTYKSSEFGITNKRVLMKTGFIQRYSLEIFLGKIEAIYVNQSIFGRLLDYGILVVVGTGGSKDPYRNVPEPLKFRRRIQQQIDLAKHESNPRALTDEDDKQ